MAYDFEKEKREARDQVRDAIWKVENVMRELERYQYQTDKELVRTGITKVVPLLMCK